MCKSWPTFVSYVILMIIEFSELWQCCYLLLYSSGQQDSYLISTGVTWADWWVWVWFPSLPPPPPPPHPPVRRPPPPLLLLWADWLDVAPGVGQGPSCPFGESGLLLSGCWGETLLMLMLWWVGWIVLDRDWEIYPLGCY